MLVAVGAPFAQATASCFISPEGGVRGGLVAVGPTNPIGVDAVWHEPQAVGSETAGSSLARFATDEWKLPG